MTARRTVRLGDIVLVAEHIRGFQIITHNTQLPYTDAHHHVIAHVAGYGPIAIDDYPTKEAAVGYLDMLERELEGHDPDKLDLELRDLDTGSGGS